MTPAPALQFLSWRQLNPVAAFESTVVELNSKTLPVSGAAAQFLCWWKLNSVATFESEALRHCAP